jgi:ribonuclease III
VNEADDPDLRDNERLEFLGDAVLDLAISHMLMEKHADAREGDLSKFRAMTVNENGLLFVAQKLEIGKHLLLGRGEERTHGREKPSILANAVEALIGAVYLDAGFDKSSEIIRKLFSSLVQEIGEAAMGNDYKSLFQEYTQQHFKTRPEYQVVKESGPPHDRTFVVALKLNGKTVAEGSGKSKKAAEQKVAREAYYWMTEAGKDR